MAGDALRESSLLEAGCPGLCERDQASRIHLRLVSLAERSWPAAAASRALVEDVTFLRSAARWVRFWG